MTRSRPARLRTPRRKEVREQERKGQRVRLDASCCLSGGRPWIARSSLRHLFQRFLQAGRSVFTAAAFATQRNASPSVPGFRGWLRNLSFRPSTNFVAPSYGHDVRPLNSVLLISRTPSLIAPLFFDGRRSSMTGNRSPCMSLRRKRNDKRSGFAMQNTTAHLQLI